MDRGISSLWKSEDWWAVWIGFIIFIGSITKLIPEIPKIGKWTGNPLKAFFIIKATPLRLFL
jgi:hypothetical protein